MKFLSLLVSVLATGSTVAFAPSKIASSRTAVSRMNMAASEELYIDEERRFLMNLILLGSAGITVGAIAIPYIAFFVPPGSGGDGGGVSAKNALGDDLFATAYLTEKPAGDRSLAQGLKGDATYLIVKDDKTLETYGLNAVCTHLGCVVPWSAANNKFMCPCHGSQYAPDGHVVRGPAPLPLALAHCDTAEDGKIIFSTWTEEDFRTGGKGWWN
ncbi:rieske iron-sulfur protein of cytochrome B6/F complex [Fragilariopsis cylindrus CCMP1102]|uniref:plastoquinol--plastocyanin reductase n=1 Tax=Fragilariopsis cylindrus CCMP1102 TaxID=635003 RepID=A0A1E7FHU3_9STRA|nr:rieske iron-sulfur protein of cytochrome B6/F complex [Fragilariopsis cylindrus CCMP1102]|eukprot:OEU17742.1 rieske iron-sulfur protein of cytochrome B6/F complex [Fragilariopsis cylindrus CCMP1102]